MTQERASALSAPRFDLAGRVALITGSSRGIGLATARAMAAAGARVVISSRKREACLAAAENIRSAGGEAWAVPAHVGNDEDRRRLVAQALDAFGRLDVVVSNVGLNPVSATLQDISEATWDKVLSVNLTAHWALGRATLPELARQGGGAFVALSSIAGNTVAPMSNAYGVAKAALNHMARQLAVDWGPAGVRVNCVAPGTTDTDMIRNWAPDDAALDSVRARTPLRRIGAADDVAAAVLFLASDLGRHITGQTLIVDGGASLMGG